MDLGGVCVCVSMWKWLDGTELENFKQSSFSCLAFLVKIMFLIIFVKNCNIIHQCLITKSFAIMAVITSLIQYTLIFYISSRILWRFSYGEGSYSHTIEQSIPLHVRRSDLWKTYSEFQSDWTYFDIWEIGNRSSSYLYWYAETL